MLSKVFSHPLCRLIPETSATDQQDECHYPSFTRGTKHMRSKGSCLRSEPSEMGSGPHGAGSPPRDAPPPPAEEPGRRWVLGCRGAGERQGPWQEGPTLQDDSSHGPGEPGSAPTCTRTIITPVHVFPAQVHQASFLAASRRPVFLGQTPARLSASTSLGKNSRSWARPCDR